MTTMGRCICETENGQIVELCCTHDEYYQAKLSKLREAHENLQLSIGDTTFEALDNLQIAVKELLEVK